jgi:hypothetical protein
MSGYRFSVPEFQREYAWEKEDVEEFWSDLRRGLDDDFYFLGLIILTGTGNEMVVVDGQQRLLTLTLLAAALYHESIASDRRALADRIQATFLRFIDFASDDELPRITLAGQQDSVTLNEILEHPARDVALTSPEGTVSTNLVTAYRSITTNLADDLAPDPFKRLGVWADFLTNRLYMANFVHPDPSSAYKVFEVVNTRGKELTTADLLKSYVLSQTSVSQRQARYEQWQNIAGQFPSDNPNLFVQFIRHVVTVREGHVPPKDLYEVLASGSGATNQKISPETLMELLSNSLPLYLQMIDATNEGPANEFQLGVFSVLSRLGVISVRPLLLAIADTDNAGDGMARLLKLVVRRVVVGNLGTGNVERRFGVAAQRIARDRAWEAGLLALADLSPRREDFVNQLHRRSLNPSVLGVARQSVLQQSIVPEPNGFLHNVMPRQSDWPDFPVDVATYWASTIGNTFLAQTERRPPGTNTWDGFREGLLPLAVEGEWTDRILAVPVWNEFAVNSIGAEMARAAADVWYE